MLGDLLTQRAHAALPLPTEVAQELVEAVRWLRDENKAPNFSGMIWVFKGRDALDELYEYCIPCHQILCHKALVCHWISNEVPGHDSAGIIGFDSSEQEHRMFSVAAQLKRDSIEVSLKTDAVVVKVSAAGGRSIGWWQGGVEIQLADENELCRRLAEATQADIWTVDPGHSPQELDEFESQNKELRSYHHTRRFNWRGQFGPVYEVRECIANSKQRTGDRFVVKQVNLHNFVNRIAFGREEEGKNWRFDDVVHEIRVLKKLKSKHPHIVDIEEVVKLEFCVCIVLEWAGSSWLDHLNNWPRAARDTFDLSEELESVRTVVRCRLALLRQLFKVVCFLHEENSLNHLDISLENCLIHAPKFQEPCLKLADFGASQFAENRKKLLPGWKGKFYAMAPEVYARSDRFDGAACDAWSVGIVAYEVIVGKRIIKCPDHSDPVFQALQRRDWEHIRELQQRQGKKWMSILEADIVKGLLDVNPDMRMPMRMVIAKSEPWDPWATDRAPASAFPESFRTRDPAYEHFMLPSACSSFGEESDIGDTQGARTRHCSSRFVLGCFQHCHCPQRSSVRAFLCAPVSLALYLSISVCASVLLCVWCIVQLSQDNSAHLGDNSTRTLAISCLSLVVAIWLFVCCWQLKRRHFCHWYCEKCWSAGGCIYRCKYLCLVRCSRCCRALRLRRRVDTRSDSPNDFGYEERLATNSWQYEGRGADVSFG